MFYAVGIRWIAILTLAWLCPFGFATGQHSDGFRADYTGQTDRLRMRTKSQ